MPFKELQPIIKNKSQFEEIEKEVLRLLRDELYLPLLEELGAPDKVLNAIDSDLIEAIRGNKITFSKGKFVGKFSASISKELKGMGAKWKDGSWKIDLSALPQNVSNAVRASSTRRDEAFKKIDKRLSDFSPNKISNLPRFKKLFDKAIWKTNQSVKKSVESISVLPKLTSYQNDRISTEWANNMDKYIQDFSQKQIKDLRKKMQNNYLSGNRYDGMVNTIQRSYGVSERKATFLARQETHLLNAKFQEARFAEAGVHEYKWRSVTGTNNHPTRARHKALNDASQMNGKIFRFDDPPVTTEPGQPERKNNPGEDFNCFPGSVSPLLDRPIYKLFRRSFLGELTTLICDGKALHATNNHPILTNRGWLSAKDLQIGDYIFERMLNDVLSPEVDRKDMIPSFEQIFNALLLISEISTHSLSESDFHGDVGPKENVDIISTDRKLVLDGISKILEEFEKFNLSFTDSFTFGNSLFFSRCERSGLTSDSIMGFFSELKTLFFRHMGHSDEIGFRNVSSFHSGNFQPSGYDTSRDGIFSSDRKFTHPIIIILDRLLIDRVNDTISEFSFRDITSISSQSLAQYVSEIGVFPKLNGNLSQTKSGFVKPLRLIDKKSRSFNGHIYNLETNVGWYFADSIISGNCRCQAIPLVRFNEKK